MMSGNIKIDKKKLNALVLGGAILGGGGGGWMEEGRELGLLALEKGFSEILPIQSLPQDSMLLTVSAVGASTAGTATVSPEDYIRSVELFVERAGMKIDGLISSEIGGMAVVNGWVQSAALKIPVVDAPADGRAHPLGVMGSMGFHLVDDFISAQTAVGGSRESEHRVEAYYEAPLAEAARLVRDSAARAGGMVAVARNPAAACFVRDHGAPGALAMALGIGNTWLRHKKLGPQIAVAKILDKLGGKFITRGRVKKVNYRRTGELEIGEAKIKAGQKDLLLTFWNEYLALEEDGNRIATFPDLMMTFDAETAMPLISVQVKEGCDILVIAVPSEKLILGAGVQDTEILRQLEGAIGKGILKYRGKGRP